MNKWKLSESVLIVIKEQDIGTVIILGVRTVQREPCASKVGRLVHMQQ